MSRSPRSSESLTLDAPPAAGRGRERERERRLAVPGGRGHRDTERRLSDRRIADRRAAQDAADRARLAEAGPADAPPLALVSPTELQTALDSVSDPLYVVDRHWRLRYLNSAAVREREGDPETAALGQLLWTVCPAFLDAEIHQRLVDAMRERRAARAESSTSTAGEWFSTVAYPVGDGLLVLYHRGGTLQADARHLLDAERAARAEAEQQREEAQRLAAELRTARETADGVRRAAERARADAEAAARTKSDFLATMSHELRTPINAITGYTQLLDLGVAGPVTDAQRSYLSRLYASGRHLLGLVDDVLDLANLERGRISVAHDHLTTGAVVAASLALIAPEAAARSIRLVDEGNEDGEEELSFIGDEHRVRQILLNLLSNAVKFTAPGGTVAVRSGRVVRRTRAGGQGGPSVCLSVRDTGIGIDSEQQGAIFEPFTQADSSRTRVAGGTGLGLAISRRLARLMQGDLTVDSRLGEGSTFSLLLPADPAALPQPYASAPPASSSVRPVYPSTDAPATGDIGAASDTDDGVGTPIAEIGARLREQMEPLLDAFIGRLRSDPVFGAARILSRAWLEDHTLSMLGAVVHALVVIEEGGGLEGEQLRDGSAIQEHIAFHHGEQRLRLGWTESMLDREYAILTEEVLALARRIVPGEDDGAQRLLGVLQRLLDRAHQVSIRGYQHARRFGHP